MFFSPRYHVHGFASVIVGNQEKKQPDSLPSITCVNFNIMVVYHVHCKAWSKTAVWNIIISISCYISNRSICYAYIMQINNIINYQLLKRWPTLCRYFQVKFFWKNKTKQKQTRRRNCLTFDEIFSLEVVLFCPKAANYVDIWSNYELDGSFQFMNIGGTLK